MSAPTQNNDNTLALLVAAVLFGGTVVAGAGALWLRGVDWLVAHHVIVAAADSPLLAVPYAQGAGLDWSRLLVLAGVLLALVAWGASAARRTYRRRQEVR